MAGESLKKVTWFERKENEKQQNKLTYPFLYLRIPDGSHSLLVVWEKLAQPWIHAGIHLWLNRRCSTCAYLGCLEYPSQFPSEGKLTVHTTIDS
jgi:hypothetical protein